VPPEARWAVEGDRGVTYSATPPEARASSPANGGRRLSRPQLISFDERWPGVRHRLGDTITVNVLGRDIEAKIASLRRIEWTTLRINFVFVYLARRLDKAPHTFLATVKATPDAEDAIFKTVTDQFPNVTVVRIRDAIETAASVLGNIGLASRVIGFSASWPACWCWPAPCWRPSAPGARGRGHEGAGRHPRAHRRHLRLGVRALRAGDGHRRVGVGTRGRLSRGHAVDEPRLDLPAPGRRGGRGRCHGADLGLWTCRHFGCLAPAPLALLRNE
jgi:hypothetical protein